MLRQGDQEITELRILGKIILCHVTEREGGEDWEGETKLDTVNDRIANIDSFPFRFLTKIPYKYLYSENTSCSY